MNAQVQVAAPTDIQVEQPLVTSVRLRAKRRSLWMRYLWARESVPVHPLAVSHEEVDRILADPSAIDQAEREYYAAEPEAVSIGESLRAAEIASLGDPRLRQLVDRLELTAAERNLLVLAVATAMDPRLGRVFAYLHDRLDLSHATPLLARWLYPEVEGLFLPSPRSVLLRWDLLRPIGGVSSDGALGAWQPSPGVVAWLSGRGDDDLPAGAVVLEPEGFRRACGLYPSVLSAMIEFASRVESGAGAQVEIELVGAQGSGRRTLAGQFAASLGRPLVSFTGSESGTGHAEGDAGTRLVEAQRAAVLRDAVLYWAAGDGEAGADAHTLRDHPGVRIVGRTRASADEPRQQALHRTLEIPALSRTGRLDFWKSLTDETPPREIADWVLTPGEIVAIRSVARAGRDAITQACHRPTDSASLLVRLPLPYVSADLVLPDAVRRQIDDVADQVRHRWGVYEEWGFERLCPGGRGIVALFAGPSGTGKTMAAQVIARSLGLELYRLDSANVVNKYIGETEKRLKRIFDDADRGNFLLLVDECEGMLGQRFASRDAHDRYANLEIDYLLQRLERFQGVAILTTNRKNDLDGAFLRRLRLIVDFMPPGLSERRTLWHQAFRSDDETSRRYLDALDLNVLAERYTLTGAEIKTTALNAAFLARAAGDRVRMNHVVEALRRELAKKGQTFRGLE